jgi:TRAP transporter TAXI family solute receptor
MRSSHLTHGIRSRPVLAALAYLLAAVSSLPADAQLRRVTIGSNPAGTNFYVVASGLAKLLQDEIRIPATVRPYSGSSVYIPMLQRGEIALGVNTQIDTYAAYSGLEPYGAPMANLRLLVALMPLFDNFLVRSESGVRSVEDLRQRRVVIAIRSNVALERFHWAIMATGGLGPDDIEAVSVASLPDGIRMLTEGRVDAAPIGLETALARQADATVPGGIRFIPLGQAESRLVELVPGSRVDTVHPESASVGIQQPLRVARFDTYLNTGAHISDADAHRIVKTIHEQWESLRQDYALLRSITAEMIAPSNSPHPYHPGAVEYFRQAGLWTDAHERNQLRALGTGAP